jgi:hypothetical protein
MGDSQTSDRRPMPAGALRDGRWIAIIFWAGMLVALLLTSAGAVTSLVQGGLYSRSFTIGTNSAADAQHQAEVISILSLIIEAGIGVILLAAWVEFVGATTSLIEAYVGETGDDDELPMAADRLGDEPETRLRTPTVVGNVLLYIGIAWAVIVVGPGALAVAAAFS